MSQTAQSTPTGHSTSSLADLRTVVTAAPARTEAPDADDQVTSGRPVGESTGPGLVVTRGPDAGRRFELSVDSASVLGRHPDCGVALTDVTVSRRHAEIRPDGGEFTLADSGSLNGTYVNRQPIDTITLSHGDEIAIGVFRLQFSARG